MPPLIYTRIHINRFNNMRMGLEQHPMVDDELILTLPTVFSTSSPQYTATWGSKQQVGTKCKHSYNPRPFYQTSKLIEYVASTVASLCSSNRTCVNIPVASYTLTKAVTYIQRTCRLWGSLNIGYDTLMSIKLGFALEHYAKCLIFLVMWPGTQVLISVGLHL